MHFAGTMRMEAELDIADMLDLDRRVAHDAATQAALGSTESLQVRRAKALGNLARTQTALDLHAQGAAPTSPKDSDGLPAAREVVLHAHFDATLDDLTTVFGPTGRMEEGQRLVLLDQVKDWCRDSRTKVTVKPVIDLNADLVHTGVRGARPDPGAGDPPGHDVRVPVVHPPGPRLRHRPRQPVRPDAEAEGRPQPGPTQSDNLAALCRSHHRLKTHTAWRYRMTEPGVFEWTSPHGHHYRRDRPAPPRSTRPSHPTRPTSRDHADDDPAPHPATLRWRGPGTSRPSDQCPQERSHFGLESRGSAAEARCQGGQMRCSMARWPRTRSSSAGSRRITCDDPGRRPRRTPRRLSPAPHASRPPRLAPCT